MGVFGVASVQMSMLSLGFRGFTDGTNVSWTLNVGIQWQCYKRYQNTTHLRYDFSVAHCFYILSTLCVLGGLHTAGTDLSFAPLGVGHWHGPS